MRCFWSGGPSSLVAQLDQAVAPAFPMPLLSVGFPFGIRTGRGKAIGQCCTLSDHERAHLFVPPSGDDPLRVLDVVTHELIHAAVGCHQGHRGPFATIARAIGLTGSLRVTMPGPALQARLAAIIGRVGPTPHLALDPELLERSRTKQGTRQRTYTCPSCGQILRAATATTSRRSASPAAPPKGCRSSSSWHGGAPIPHRRGCWHRRSRGRGAVTGCVTVGISKDRRRHERASRSAAMTHSAKYPILHRTHAEAFQAFITELEGRIADDPGEKSPRTVGYIQARRMAKAYLESVKPEMASPR